MFCWVLPRLLHLGRKITKGVVSHFRSDEDGKGFFHNTLIKKARQLPERFHVYIWLYGSVHLVVVRAYVCGLIALSSGSLCLRM